MARSHRDFYPLLTCSLMCRCTLAPCHSGTAGSRATLNTIWSSVLGGGLWKGSCIQRSLCHPGLAVIMTTTVSPSQLCLTGILKEQQNRNAYQPEALDATLPVARELVVSLKYNDIDWALLLAQRLVWVSLSHRGLLLWNLWLPSLLRLAFVRLQRWWKWLMRGSGVRDLLGKVWTGGGVIDGQLILTVV